MKLRSLIAAAALCTLCVGQASALEYTVDAPEDYLFGTPTSEGTVYEQESNNVDRGKNTALIPPGFGTATSYLPGSGEPLTPNLLPGAMSGGLISSVKTDSSEVSYPTVDSTADHWTGASFTAVTPNLYYNDDHLGTLSIPSIGLNVKVYEDNRGMFEMADGHTLLRYLEAAYFGTVTWEIVPGTPYERAILGEVDKTTPEYRAFYQKICDGAVTRIKNQLEKEIQNVKEPITEINRDSFWNLIHEAKNACGQDMDAMLTYLKDRLVSMGPAQAQNFLDIIHAYEDLADKYGLWDAAGIMKEYGCSDDGFIDFRAWLIAQGREVYFAALADPDSLADVVPYGDCRFEQLSYVGDYAYEQLTGKSAYDQTDWSAYEALLMKLEQEIVYKGGIEFPREGADLKKYLPRLCAKHPEWDGQTRWNPQLKEIRDLIHAGKYYDRRQT